MPTDNVDNYIVIPFQQEYKVMRNSGSYLGTYGIQTSRNEWMENKLMEFASNARIILRNHHTEN